MEYGRFLSVAFLIITASLTIYIGCLRSYAIYFFERDTKRIVFLEPWSAATVPVVLSFMLIVSYLSAKRMKTLEDEIAAKKLEKSSQSSLCSSRSRKISRSSDLESIPETPPVSSEKLSESNLRSILESGESDEQSEHTVERRISQSSDTPVDQQVKEEDRSRANAVAEKVLETLAKESGASSEVIFGLTQLSVHDSKKISLDNFPPSKKSSIMNSHELEIQRKQSQIYKEIGKISFVPFSMPNSFFPFKKRTVIGRFQKDPMFDIVLQLIGVHLPLWLSVIAVHITLVEIFNMKFYYQFYYHHPGMKLLALLISVLIGLFHEIRFTWYINNMLGIAAAYVIISRVQTVSCAAGIIFLVGMVLFDLFWIYGIDLFSTVTRQSRAPVMVIIPWGNEGKREMLATLDIIVPGIFLNIVLKFADMYDSRAFLPSFYAALFGLVVTFVVAFRRAKSTPAMVLPAFFSIITSLLSVERPLDFLRFEIKH